LARKTVWRELLSLATPIIGLNVLNVLALLVDTMMCGRLPDSELALSALGYATQILFLAMVLMIGLTVGTVAQVARAWGAGQHRQANHVMDQSVQLTVVVAALVGLAGNLIAEPVLLFLGATQEITDAALTYLRPMLIGTVFSYLVILFAAILRGVGSTRPAFWIALGINLMNFGLNWLLILGNAGFPSLGIRGAAIGTLTAQAFGVLLFVLLFRRGIVHGVCPKLRPVKSDPEVLRTLRRVGVPAATDMVILNAAFLSIIGMLGRIDPIAVAAHAIGLRVQTLAFVPGMSVSQATGALVGQALGANDAERAKKVVLASVGLCTAIMSTLALILYAGAAPIVESFGVDPFSSLGEDSMLWIRILGVGMPVIGLTIAFNGMLQGSGDTRTALAINAIGTIAIQIPLSWLLGFPLGMGIAGVWAAFPLAFIIKAALSVWVYRREKWLRLGVSA